MRNYINATRQTLIPTAWQSMPINRYHGHARLSKRISNSEPVIENNYFVANSMTIVKGSKGDM